MVFSKSITFDERDPKDAANLADATTVLTMAEAEFVAKLQAGDANAFDLLITKYAADVNSLLFRITEDAEDAGELTQETFMSALRSIGSFRGDSGVRTWLFRIAINHSRNRFRWWQRRGRNKTVSLDAPIGRSDVLIGDTIESDERSPEENAIITEQQTSLRQALLDLPEVYREAVVLCDIEGLTYDEISHSLNVSLGTVKSRIARAREELRRRLKDI